MITGYRISNANEIYLYVDFSYEFAMDLATRKEKRPFVEKVKDFLKRKNISYRDKRIILVSNGIIIGSLLLGGFVASKMNLNEQVLLNSSNQITYFADQQSLPWDEIIEEEIEQVEVIKKKPEITKPKENLNIEVKHPQVEKPNIAPKKTSKPESNHPATLTKTYVTLHRSNGSIEKIELEEYLIGVVAAEMPASFHMEALKAQAIAARTYTLKQIEQGNIMTDTTATQAYKDMDQLKEMWGNTFATYYSRIKNAVLDTEGKVITYKGSYIDAVYHSMSNGMTEDAQNVWGNSIPYLKSVDSHWDLDVPGNEKRITKDLNVVTDALGFDLRTAIPIVEKNKSGRLSVLVYDDIIFTGKKIRELFGLRSTDIVMTVSGDEVIFTTKGYGHGVGMSQYGANAMAKEGYTCNQILRHYYQGVTIVS